MSQESTKLGPPWTTIKILRWTQGYFEKHGIDNSRFEAELLLSHALDLERMMLYAYFERPLEKDELDNFRAMVKRRVANEPVAYITGSRGFWSIDLKTDHRALIPRPDTETLVSGALDFLPEGEKKRVLDIGTGTGAVALALAHDRPELEVAATDISPDALSLARENADALGLTERVSFFEGDLLGALEGDAAWGSGTIDVIVSNPPYVGTSEMDLMDESVKKYEPETALYAGEDGLDIIRRLVPQVYARLDDGGHFLCEIGFAQGKAVREIFEEQGFADVKVLKDLGKNDRVVLGCKRA